MGYSNNSLPKPFIEIGGVPLLRRVISPFLEFKEIELILVAANPDFYEHYHRVLDGVDSRIQIIQGGATRQQSVCNGLEYYKNFKKNTDDCFAIIHDAARCFITEDNINNAIVMAGQFNAVTLGISVYDSLRAVDSDTLKIIKSIDRTGIYAVQTPQIFKFNLIYDRHIYFKEKSINSYTDDTALLDGMHDVYIVPGSKSNIKITTGDDLLLADMILQTR